MVDLYFSASDEREFKKQFVISFMASYVAKNFDDCCARSEHQRLREPPVEDGHHLAEEAWNHWVKINGLNEQKSSEEGAFLDLSTNQFGRVLFHPDRDGGHIEFQGKNWTPVETSGD